MNNTNTNKTSRDHQIFVLYLKQSRYNNIYRRIVGTYICTHSYFHCFTHKLSTKLCGHKLFLGKAIDFQESIPIKLCMFQIYSLSIMIIINIHETINMKI